MEWRLFLFLSNLIGVSLSDLGSNMSRGKGWVGPLSLVRVTLSIYKSSDMELYHLLLLFL